MTTRRYPYPVTYDVEARTANEAIVKAAEKLRAAVTIVKVDVKPFVAGWYSVKFEVYE